MNLANLVFRLTYQRIGLFLLSVTVLFLSSCEKAQEKQEVKNNETSVPPPALVSKSAHKAISANDSSVKVARKALAIKPGSDFKRTEGSPTYIHFGDRTACTWNPNICSNTFVTWPGYIQSTGYNDWGYAWMSYGPGAGFIPYGTGDHYHIIGLLFPADEPNPSQTAMFGTDWFAFYMQRSGVGRINFDLREIRVRGTVPVTLWFKAADNSWWYWPSIGPGWWSLPGAGNIQEFHIRAASGRSTDKYSLDDILVRGL